MSASLDPVARRAVSRVVVRSELTRTILAMGSVGALLIFVLRLQLSTESSLLLKARMLRGAWVLSVLLAQEGVVLSALIRWQRRGQRLIKADNRARDLGEARQKGQAKGVRLFQLA